MTQILRGLSGGLSNLARGVATASEDWPAASARRRQLEIAEERLARSEELDTQRQENFEATQRRLIRAENRQQRNSEISTLNSQISSHKNMHEQYMQAGMKAEAQEELNMMMEKKEQVRNLGLYGGVAEDVEEEQGSSGEDVCDVIFKVKLEKPEPKEVKISKKNVCLVTIVKGEEEQ